jgi:hypothetical protein
MAQPMRVLMPPIAEATRARRDAEMGDVMVIEYHQVCGMVTDQDIVVRTVAEAWDPAITTLADLGRHAFVTVPPRTASSRRCGSCARRPCAACPWSTGGSRWAWWRSGIGR